MMDMMTITTVSDNSAPAPEPDYTDQINVISNDLRDLSGKLDKLLELLEQEKTLEEPEEETEEAVSENAALEPPEVNVYVLVSGNTVSENTVSQNALITTPLSDYSVTDSLILLILILMVLGDVLQFIFFKRRGE